MAFFTTFGLIACLLTSIPFVHSADLIYALTQNQTNGNSTLGTLAAPRLPPFLTTDSSSKLKRLVERDDTTPPWSPKTANNTNPYTDPPVTGIVRSYNFVIERGYKAPDGVNKSVILINGQFPGPTIEANWGDTIQVTVQNNIEDEGTSLHWHGILQKGTPWYDGVPSVQQCPIAPGKSLTYTFNAEIYGTTWYHSHYSAQYADGLLGPLIIYGPETLTNQVDLGPIFLSDYYYPNYYSIVEKLETPGVHGAPASDNNLINGKGDADCDAAVAAGYSCVSNAGLSKFSFTSGKTHRLRLINAGAEGLQKFTIDNHVMTVIANDFVPIIPYNTTVVTLGIGQRSDVLVTATGSSTDAVWMRSDISAHCSKASRPNALAAIYYEDADNTTVPTTSPTLYDDSHCGNDPLNETVPFYNYDTIPSPAVTQQIEIRNEDNPDSSPPGKNQWFMNNSTFRANYNYSLLALANQGNTSYPNDPQWNVYDFGTNSSIRIVLYNYFGNNVSHPMHLHGHNFWVVAEGVGQWDGNVEQVNPQRRDVQLLQPMDDKTGEPGFVVLEFQSDNPGVWPLHCHIAWHVSQGLYVNVIERSDLIKNYNIPAAVDQTCTDWISWASDHVVDQIDSGL